MEIADLRLHLDGCPHACAQHWVGDLGFQGTTARDEATAQAYDIFARGQAYDIFVARLARRPRARARDRPLALPARADRRARRAPSGG